MCYVAQETVKIDTDIGQKDHLWVETNDAAHAKSKKLKLKLSIRPDNKAEGVSKAEHISISEYFETTSNTVSGS